MASDKPATVRLEAVLKDSTIEKLSAASGSAESLSFGRNVAIAGLAVGMLGALGALMRPLYRKSFAANAARDAAVQSARAASSRRAGTSDAELAAAVERLDALQARHRERHPHWYGLPTQR
jgi:hypothetical protein